MILKLVKRRQKEIEVAANEDDDLAVGKAKDPPTFMAPLERDKGFVPRPELLNALIGFIWQTTRPNSIALVGRGGVG